MDLKKQVTQGAIWVFIDQFAVQLVSFLVSLVLARLLMPADFGTIALFNVVINISSVLINGGLSSSLVRTQSVDNRDLSTVFWFNIVMTLLLYLGIFIISPYIAQFYGMPILAPIIRVYSVVLIIDSFVHVQAVLFDKRLDFKTTFKVRLPSIIVGGLCGVGFALTGFGVWSLVYSALIQNSLYTLQYWFYSDWRPTFEFDRKKFRYHFAFGFRLTLSALLNVLFNNVYSIVIGKRFAETTLGYYNRAESFKNLPINNVSTALNKVTYPLFAKFSNDNEKLRHAYRQILKLVIFIVAPLICMMMIAAEPIIGLLLGEKWLPVIPYFQILALGALFQPIHNYNLNILQVKGRSDLYLRLEIIKKLLVIVAVVLGLRFGIYG
ncbi:MAG: lipopolysaccharide biosynthesis protein, partial [Sphingobacterium sp.]|nr:lipopolysaccharide biosynthesis protein [Sphingobacterium sp.]